MGAPTVGQRVGFWALLGVTSTAFAEVLFPTTAFDVGTMAVFAFPIYLLHSVVLVGVAYGAGRVQYSTLYLAGVVLGLYEAYVTKVVWAPLGDRPVVEVGGVYVFETVGLVLFWHPVVAFVLPVAVVETVATASNRSLRPPLAGHRFSRPLVVALAAYLLLFRGHLACRPAHRSGTRSFSRCCWWRCSPGGEAAVRSTTCVHCCWTGVRSARWRCISSRPPSLSAQSSGRVRCRCGHSRTSWCSRCTSPLAVLWRCCSVVTRRRRRTRPFASRGGACSRRPVPSFSRLPCSGSWARLSHWRFPLVLRRRGRSRCRRSRGGRPRTQVVNDLRPGSVSCRSRGTMD